MPESSRNDRDTSASSPTQSAWSGRGPKRSARSPAAGPPSLRSSPTPGANASREIPLHVGRSQLHELLRRGRGTQLSRTVLIRQISQVMVEPAATVVLVVLAALVLLVPTLILLVSALILLIASLVLVLLRLLLALVLVLLRLLLVLLLLLLLLLFLLVL